MIQSDMSFISNQDVTPFRVLVGVIAGMPGHVYWKDVNGVYLGCNNNQAKSLGLASSQEILGKTDFDLPGDKARAAIFWKNDQKVMLTGQSVVAEEDTIVDGKVATVLTYKNPLMDDAGNIIGVLGISVDISELKHKERELLAAKKLAEIASQAKSEFIQNMSHDLRTPLTGLLGVSESQVTFLDDSDPHKDNYGLIFDSAKQLQRMFEQILQTASLDYQENAGNPTAFSIETVINNVVALLKPSLANKKLTHTVSLLGQLPDVALLGHPLMIERVLMNLLGNAIKFTDKGTVQIQYGIEEHAKTDNPSDRWLKVRIRDNGIGIPADKQAAIFDLFTRLSPAYQGTYDGHGLGLYITQKLIRLMGGTVSVESEGEGKGTTFTCRIPVTLTDQPLSSLANTPLQANNNQEIDSKVSATSIKRNRTTAPQISDHSDQTHYNVLLVEDNHIAINVASGYLARYHCAVTVAQTLKEALSLAEQHHYDCIFMDVGLPDGDGRDATRTIRSTETFANAHTPIIGLTAHADPVIRQDCLVAGMNAVYNKPLTPQRIETVLNDIVIVVPAMPQQVTDNGEVETVSHDNNDVPVINISAAMEKMQCQEADVLDLLAQFIESLPQEEQAMRTAYRGDGPDRWENVNKVIHRIRGACGYCGASRLQRACEQFETQFRLGVDDDEPNTLYQAVLVELNNLNEQYQQL